MNEGARGHELRMLDVGELFGRCRRREDVGEEEESECDTKSRAEHSPEHEEHDTAPESVHGLISSLLLVFGRRLQMKGQKGGDAE
jgi:hypothetical protein